MTRCYTCMAKPKIFFIPTYIGPLKHYERLIPYLKDRYEVGFLIVRPDSPRRREMIEYCQAKKYTFYVIDQGLAGDTKIRIPFFTPLKKRYEHSMACRNFLEAVRPVKIISHKSWSPYDTIFKEANQKGIETIVLQWSSDAGLIEGRKRQHIFLQKTYFYWLEKLYRILDLFYKESRYRCTPAIPKKIGVFSEKKAQDYLKKDYDSKTIRVVGSIDFQLVHELKQKIDSNKVLREQLLKKYGLDQNRLKIMVVLHRFYLDLGENRMTIAEHVSHHYEMFKIIHEVFAEENVHIILKMHPTENTMPEIYESYKQLGVKLYHGEAKTDELLCLADLYISEPASSVNYMVLASGTPAIFVNFSKAYFLNERMKYFYIKQIVSDQWDFRRLLLQFKHGTLEKQYDNTRINVRSVEAVIELINE